MPDAGGLGILGIGNVLIGDDAIGPHVIALLESRWEWPRSVTLIDAGTPGPELASLMLPFEAVLVVDAVETGEPPGCLVCLGKEALAATASPNFRTPHDPGLSAALLHFEFLGQGPREITLLGIVPDRTHTGTTLSPSARSALPGLLALVLREAARHGILPGKREAALPENLWWESKR